MGRRYYSNNVGSRETGEQRMSIGDRHVDEAISRINKLAGATAATMASYDLTVDQTLPMLFRDEDLEKAKAAKGLIEPSGSYETYDLGKKSSSCAGVTLGIMFKDHSFYPTLWETALQINQARFQPLLNYIETVKGIYHQFEEVKALLRWMNRNATPGAIRYYWPTALKLCPTSPALMEVAATVPSRFTVPPKIHDYLDIVKTSASTIAASAMLPSTAKPQECKAMWLTFAPKEIPLGFNLPGPTSGGATMTSYETDQITFNI